jgi:hypothetical protein
MPSDNDQRERRQRTTGNRTGSARAAVKPHKRTSDASAAHAPSGNAAAKPQAQAQQQAPTQGTLDVSAILTAWVNSLGGARLNQTYLGSSLSKKLDQAARSFGIPKGESAFLVLDATIFGTCKAGLALCSKGIYLRDTAGAQDAISWTKLPATKLGADAQSLTIGKHKIVTVDGIAVGKLLATIQKAIAG